MSLLLNKFVILTNKKNASTFTSQGNERVNLKNHILWFNFPADYSHELYGSLYKNIGGYGLFILSRRFFHSTISVSGISITFSSSSAIMAQKSHQNNKAINTIAATFLQVLSILLKFEVHTSAYNQHTFMYVQHTLTF